MKGDFTGFSFDRIHSSQLGIVHVSNGDRYSEFLMPEFEDKIVPRVGSNGNFYFGSDYRQKSISISIAFDSVSEEQFRQIGRLFSTKKICPLIFDERPYKVYMAKITTPIQLDYICFDEFVTRNYSQGGGIKDRDIPLHNETERERVYKGEGTIEFICVNGFARQQFKYLDLYGPYEGLDHPYTLEETGNVQTIYTNIEQWADASRLLTYEEYNDYKIDRPQSQSEISGYNFVIPIYNAGDINSPYYLFLPYSSQEVDEQGTLEAAEGDLIVITYENSAMQIQPFTAKQNLEFENGVIINTENHLIEGVKYDRATGSWVTTGNIYNEYIKAGDFKKIKANDWLMDKVSNVQTMYLNCATAENATIHYDYLYY